MNKTGTIIVMIALVAIVFIVPFVGIRYIDPYFQKDITGWMQAAIALVGLPILLLELDQIRRNLNRRPVLDVGLVTVADLPLSKVRLIYPFKTKAKITTGYAHFFLVVRNLGNAPAKSVKIYIEHDRDASRSSYRQPMIKVSEFSEEKVAFVAENNFAFVFRAGANWVINQGDTEIFGFHTITAFITPKTNSAGYQYNEYEFDETSTIVMDCTIWADGLNKSVQKTLEVEIVQHRQDMRQ